MTIHLPVIRQSLLEDAKCLYRFHALHIEGIKEPSNEFQERGVDLHALHSKYVNHLLATDQEFDFEYAANLASSPEWNRDAVAIFNRWYPSQIFEPRKIYGTEVKIELGLGLKPISLGEVAAYSGILDRLEISGTTATVVDLKSHFGSFAPTTIQSFFYPWLIRKSMPYIEKIGFELHFVRWNIVRKVEFTAEEIDQLQVERVFILVEALAAAIEDNEFPAIANAKCSICSLECPLIEAGARREAVGQIPDQATATELAGILYVMEKKVAKLQLSLKGHAIEFGPIAMDNGISLGFKRRTSIAYDAKNAMKLNLNYGFDPLRAISVKTSEVKKIGKRYPDYISELARTAKDKSTTTFGFVNAEEPEIEETEEEW